MDISELRLYELPIGHSMSSADALTKTVRLGKSQRPLPVQAIGVQDNSTWQRGKLHGLLSGAEP